MSTSSQQPAALPSREGGAPGSGVPVDAAAAVPAKVVRLERPATLADIARAAGTSLSTASRALSGRGYVAAAVRRRLFEVADELGYVPDASAQALKQRTSRTIGVVVCDLGDSFYAQAVAGIEQTLRNAGYQVVLVTDNKDGAQELAAARTFLTLRTPGVIIAPVGSEATTLLRLQGVSVVEIDRQLSPGECDAVVLDNRQAAIDAMSHVLALGHTRIGLLTVGTAWNSDAGRQDGYRLALERAGIPVDDELVSKVTPTESDSLVERRIRNLLGQQGLTAIFAANNVLTVRAWRVLRQVRLRIPEDLSLVGFDDAPWMDMVTPGITVVAQPAFDIGRRAASLLLRRVENRSLPPAVECLHGSLIVRGSTGPPRKRR
jgi:LacI family transcriptional regulator